MPEAFIIGEDFIKKDNVALILGDNFFYGQNLSKKLNECRNLKNGAKIFLHPVNNPNLYGVAAVNKYHKIVSLKEKPKKPKTNLAVTGLYFFDNKVVSLSKKLKPSKRGELEIIDLLNRYKNKKKLKAEYLGRGGVWLDTGSIEDFYDASNFIATVEKRQGLKIACLEEISLKNGWINKNSIKESIKFYGKCKYSIYLDNLLK